MLVMLMLESIANGDGMRGNSTGEGWSPAGFESTRKAGSNHPDDCEVNLRQQETYWHEIED
jgi:hypothetical protein